LRYSDKSKKIIWKSLNSDYRSKQNEMVKKISDDIILELGMNGVPIDKIKFIGDYLMSCGDDYCGGLIRGNFVSKRKDNCEMCGSTKKLTNHHIKPKRSHRWLQYNPSNSMTLCESCHRIIHTTKPENIYKKKKKKIKKTLKNRQTHKKFKTNKLKKIAKVKK